MSQNLISLKVKCPYCKQSLMDYTTFLNAKPSIKLHIDVKGKHGVIHLCSTYGCYEKSSNVELVDMKLPGCFVPTAKRSSPQP